MNARWVKNYVQQFAARIANYAITGAATAMGLKDTVEGRETGEDEPKYGLTVRRIWPFGHRSVPPAGCEGIILRVNAGRRSLVLIAAESQKYGPKDLRSGETATYDAAGSVIRLSQDGSLTITAKGGGVATFDKDGNVTVVPAAGKKVKLGDGVDANLDPVALFPALKSWLEGHVHQPGSFVAGMTSVSGISGSPTSTVPAAASSSNVVAKK